METLEKRTMGKVARRLIPFLMICYFFCFLDRVNVSFAALQMNQDLGFSASVFGFGAGIMFVAYMLCEAPSNLVLVKVGTRRWIARIMVTWGLVAIGMAFVKGATSFYIMRTLLGAAEAGFFPGIIFYLTEWFPGSHRGRATGLFMACMPLSTAIGSPISTALLYLDGVAGLRGWQWLFIAEGIPSVILGVVTWFYLTARPAEATWLSHEERNWLSARVAAEHERKRRQQDLTLIQTLFNPQVIALGLVAFAMTCLLFGVGFFLPSIVKSFGLTNMQTGWVSIIPSAAGSAAMLWWGRHSDRTMERKGHLLIALTLAAVGVAAAAFLDQPVLKMAAFTVSAIGLYAANPVFWTLAPNFLTGASAAVGIAYINSFAGFGAFVAPWMMGLVKDATGSFAYALLVIASLIVGAGFIVLSFRHDSALERDVDLDHVEGAVGIRQATVRHSR